MGLGGFKANFYWGLTIAHSFKGLRAAYGFRMGAIGSGCKGSEMEPFSLNPHGAYAGMQVFVGLYFLYIRALCT